MSQRMEREIIACSEHGISYDRLHDDCPMCIKQVREADSYKQAKLCAKKKCRHSLARHGVGGLWLPSDKLPCRDCPCRDFR